MDNPNESILLTEHGTPIGEVVVADNSSVPPAPTEASVSENREIMTYFGAPSSFRGANCR